jgi:flagellar hook-associated protein FlgK
VPAPTFSIHDSNNAGAAGSAVFSGMANSLLGVLGAAGLDGIANSFLTADANAGSNTINVANATGYAVGDTIDIDAGNGSFETATIAAVTGNTLTLTAPLANSHVSNAEVYDQKANVAVVQNATNAFGPQDNSAAVAMSKMFQSPVGVPGIDTFVGAFIPAGPFVAPVGQSNITMTEAAVPLAQFGQINPGQQLTLVGFTPPAGPYVQLGAVVTAVNRIAGTISLQVTNNGAAPVSFNTSPPGPAGTYTALYATPTQTLGQFYGSIIAQVGLDGQTATTGTQTQTNISNSINQTRQGIDGINLDEETQNLLMYQTAYQAAAKTVTVLDTMLQSILNMVQ